MSIDLLSDSRLEPNAIHRGPVAASAKTSSTPEERHVAWPVSFNGCFGWLHTGSPFEAGDVAILICSPLDRDALDSHHGLRQLAATFAAAGYPCLRFDYPGRADSCDPGPVEHWSCWQRSIHDAADWLRRTTGARRVVFCGLRIGATLAALVADTRDDAAGLVLLAPVLRGRSYMRQLQIQASLEAELPAHIAAGRNCETAQDAVPTGLDFHDLQLSAETVALIDQADLRGLHPRFPIAIHSQGQSLLLRDCVGLWTAAGAVVFSTDFAGLEPLLAYNLVEESAPPDFSAVMTWLRGAVPQSPGAFVRGFTPPAPARLDPPGCRETALQFGPDGRLFGILCQPDSPAPADAPAVIFGNTGRDPHYAFGRFSVELARRLAASGYASLRFDFAGLGDSEGPPGHERMLSHMFEVDRTADISAAIDTLEQLGYRRFAVEGRCAGAYHGFHAALADPRIETLLLVNLPVFEWHAGDTVDFATRRTARPGPFLAKLAGSEFWQRLVKGEIHVSRFLRAQAIRLAARARVLGHHALSRLGFGGLRNISHVAMAKLAERGTRTLFIFATEDSGYDAFELEFGARGRGVLAFAGTSVAIVPDVDHQLSTGRMRRLAIDLMLAFLAAPPPGLPPPKP